MIPEATALRAELFAAQERITDLRMQLARAAGASEAKDDEIMRLRALVKDLYAQLREVRA